MGYSQKILFLFFFFGATCIYAMEKEDDDGGIEGTSENFEKHRSRSMENLKLSSLKLDSRKKSRSLPIVIRVSDSSDKKSKVHDADGIGWFCDDIQSALERGDLGQSITVHAQAIADYAAKRIPLSRSNGNSETIRRAFQKLKIVRRFKKNTDDDEQKDYKARKEDILKTIVEHRQLAKKQSDSDDSSSSSDKDEKRKGNNENFLQQQLEYKQDEIKLKTLEMQLMQKLTDLTGDHLKHEKEEAKDDAVRVESEKKTERRRFLMSCGGNIAQFVVTTGVTIWAVGK